jgi:hypothetical protein
MLVLLDIPGCSERTNLKIIILIINSVHDHKIVRIKTNPNFQFDI